MKTREKQGRKAKTQQNSHHPILWCKIRTTHPLVRILFCDQFSKSMLSVPTQKKKKKITGMRTLCEFAFVTNFQNHALCLGEPQECEIFALPITLCEIRTSSFHHQKTLQFFTQLSKSIPKPISTLLLPNHSFKLRIQATVSS